MESEKEKMLAGKLYDATDPELSEMRKSTRDLLKIINNPLSNSEAIKISFSKLFGGAKSEPWIEPPFFCDYGKNIFLGEKVYFNFNCVILDVNTVKIGNEVLFGPNVQIYTASHPLDWKTRASGLELGKPITIGNNVWIGGGAIILPGVNIGDRAVIGAGSVVTKNIPSDVFAAGNPCKVIKDLNS